MPFRNPLVVRVGRRVQFAAVDIEGARAEYLSQRNEAMVYHPGSTWPAAKVRDMNRKGRLVACISYDGRVHEPGSDFFDWLKTKRGF